MSFQEMRSDSREGRLAMYSANKFKLGLFGANCSGGRTMTKVPWRWSGDWDDCVKLALLNDEAGMDFMLPIITWKGNGGGESGYHDRVYETITWACGILQATR